MKCLILESFLFCVIFDEDGTVFGVVGRRLLFDGLFGRRRRRSLAVFGGRNDAAARLAVEHQRCRTALQTRVSALARKVAVARLAQRDVTVRIVHAQTMFLAAFDVFWVIAGVELFVVEESAGAELLDGGAVPARPEADARIDVTEDAVLVVASTFRNRWIG